jgi:lysophospholipase L1-like esterase
LATAKKLAWLIVLLLFLEVVKTVLDKMPFESSFFISTIVAVVQVLLIFFFLFYLLWIKIFKKKRMGLMVLSFLILLAMLEGLFGWWVYHPSSIPAFMTNAFQFYYYNYELDIGRYHKRLSVYDPGLFYTLRPGVNDIFETKEFHTHISANSMGLRDDELSLQQPTIICLGDSYGMGWGVEQNETFAEDLARLSGQKVLNAGIASYGTAREMILLQQLDTTALTHLVIQYCSNDYKENNEYLLNNYHLPISSRAVYDTMITRRRQAADYFPGKFFLVTSKIFFKQQVNKLIPVFKMAGMKVQKLNEKEHARAFIEVLRRSPINFGKIKVIVCPVGDAPEFGAEFVQEVNNLASKQPAIFHNNVSVVDISRGLEEKDWLTLDRHLKPSGHQKMANMIWQSIRRTGQ